MAVDIDLFVHVYISKLRRWICLPENVLHLCFRGGNAHDCVAGAWDPATSKLLQHWNAPIEFRFARPAESIIVQDPNKVRGFVRLGAGKDYYREFGWDHDDNLFHTADGTTKLWDINDIDIDAGLVKEQEDGDGYKTFIVTHNCRGEEIDPMESEPCPVCVPLADLVTKARRLQCVPPHLVVNGDPDILQEWMSSNDVFKRRDQVYSDCLDVLLSRVFDDSAIVKEIKTFLTPSRLNVVRVQFSLSI